MRNCWCAKSAAKKSTTTSIKPTAPRLCASCTSSLPTRRGLLPPWLPPAGRGGIYPARGCVNHAPTDDLIAYRAATTHVKARSIIGGFIVGLRLYLGSGERSPTRNAVTPRQPPGTPARNIRMGDVRFRQLRLHHGGAHRDIQCLFRRGRRG